ncbi:Hypothetical predicted protein [Mytilus galloprovincialis]|uniref:Uncharacterized protein n=1 Tax=Mytilus galloprovincialis TaxID=29158 RepID=A0A8B6BFW1_MYTGA|nr:Hypothetical predicted protein [Mytilus galloprovincialis]
MILADIAGNDDGSQYLKDSTLPERTSIFEQRICLNTNEGRTYSYTVMDNRLRMNAYETMCQACIDGEEKLGSFEKQTPGNTFDYFIQPGRFDVLIWFDQTPLCLSIRRGHIKLTKNLIKNGEDVNLTVEEKGTNDDASLSMIIRYGYTPLFVACQRKYYEIVDMLLERGANLNKALYDACIEGYLDTVKFLRQKGANVNSIGRFGQTVLYGACIGGYSTIVKYLISQGSVIDTKVKRASFLDEHTCLHASYLSDNHNIVHFLINIGASVDTVGNFGRTMLHTSCRDGNYEIVKILIDKEAYINSSDIYGATPLIACVSQNIEYTHAEKTFIQERRGDYFLYVNGINQPLGDYHDQLHKQCVNEWNTYFPSDLGSKYKPLTENHYKVIQLLIENGADINKADMKNRTPLALAKKIEDTKLTEILLHNVLLPIKKDDPQGRNHDS